MAKAINHNGGVGWLYNDFELTDDELSSIPLFDSWKPVEISNLQVAILSKLISDEEISTSDKWFMSLVEHPDYSITTVSELVSSGLISNTNGVLRLLTHECTIVAMPDGSIVAGDNNSGRLTTWIENQTNKKHNDTKDH